MIIDITVIQYNLILDEIARLEDSRNEVSENGDGWDWMDYKDEIQALKEIIETEQIEI